MTIIYSTRHADQNLAALPNFIDGNTIASAMPLPIQSCRLAVRALPLFLLSARQPRFLGGVFGDARGPFAAVVTPVVADPQHTAPAEGPVYMI